MNTIPSSQFNENDLLRKIYGVVCAHHVIEQMAVDRLTANVDNAEYCIKQVHFADFGKERDNPIYLSYEAHTWISPDYDRSTFIKTPGVQQEIPFLFVIDSMTFYEDIEEMQKHREELRLKSWGENAKFEYISHVN